MQFHGTGAEAKHVKHFQTASGSLAHIGSICEDTRLRNVYSDNHRGVKQSPPPVGSDLFEVPLPPGHATNMHLGNSIYEVVVWKLKNCLFSGFIEGFRGAKQLI